MSEGNGATPLVEVEHLKLHFPIKGGVVLDRDVARVHAVDEVTFALEEGKTLGLVGSPAAGGQRRPATSR